MQRMSIILSIIVVTAIFIYWLKVLSSNNTCTGVRVFDCQKSNSGEINNTLK